MLQNKIRVLMISNENHFSPNGGMGVYINEVCNKLRHNLRFDITVIGCRLIDQEGSMHIIGDEVKTITDFADWKPQDGSWRLLNIYNKNHINTRDGFLSQLITEDNYLYNLIGLKNEKFDLIHLQDCTLWRAVKHARHLFNAPIIFTTHLNQQLSRPNTSEDSRYMWLIQNEQEAYKISNCLTTVSENYRKAIEDIYGELQPIEVIHNGVDYESLSKVEYNQEVRKSLFGNDNPLVVFVGRFTYTKGLNHFFRAVYELPNINFLFISMIKPLSEEYSPHFPQLQQLIRTCKNFRFYNHKDNNVKLEYMKMADIGVMPSLHEPFGITALEWMSLGVPLITYNVGGLVEFCNSDNCTIINPDMEKFIETIKSHKRDETKIQKGIETAKVFTWDKVADKLSSLYEKENAKWHTQSD